jgi:hypothetical protein
MLIIGLLAVVESAPPNVSLATLPVGYIGSSWPSKTEAQIDMLSKLRVVTMMQQDGPCWLHCCPNMDSEGKCNNPLAFNASHLPGCDAACDQHGTQNAVYARIKAHARAAGRAEPHAMITPTASMTGRSTSSTHAAPTISTCWTWMEYLMLSNATLGSSPVTSSTMGAKRGGWPFCRRFTT